MPEIDRFLFACRWAYPGEFKDAKAAGQIKESPYRFTRAHWSRPLIWLAEGWVVLERFAMPILGEGAAEPNDTFVQQVVANAEAACEEVGQMDPNSVQNRPEMMDFVLTMMDLLLKMMNLS